MISIEVLVTKLSGLRRRDLERWILKEWVRPDVDGGHYMFHEIDVARVQLIQTLRNEMNVNDDALPVVLLLLDQVYDLRRRMREIGDALNQAAPEAVRQNMAQHLANLAS